MPRADTPAARGQAGRVQHLPLKWTVFVLLCLMPLLGSIRWLVIGQPWPLVAYGLVSLITFGLYWHDKRRAKLQGQRTPENLLHACELLGGWPGALLAQQRFRHKTRKVSYQITFWLIVLLHQLLWFDVLVLQGRYLGLAL